MDEAKTELPNKPLEIILITNRSVQSDISSSILNGSITFHCTTIDVSQFNSHELLSANAFVDLILVNACRDIAENVFWFDYLKRKSSQTPVVVLHEPGSSQYAAKLIELGAELCLSTHIISQDTIETILENVINSNRIGSRQKTSRNQQEYLPCSTSAPVCQTDVKFSEFLSSFSHDIKSPLHGILSFSSFGIKKIDQLSQAKLLDYLAKIQSCGHKILNLVNDLSDLSKLEAGLVHYEFQKYSLAEIIEIAIGENQKLQQEKQIQIELIGLNYSDTIVIDPQKMVQVFKNLVSNAIKFSDPGGTVTIQIDVERDVTMISVIDSGIGIDETDPQVLFDKYTHYNKHRSGEDSTGLGLAICHYIIQGHHGTINIRNNEEKGTRVTVRIPNRIDSYQGDNLFNAAGSQDTEVYRIE